jgi:hypothetical protein
MKYYFITINPTVNQEANDIPRIVAPVMYVGSLFPGVILPTWLSNGGPAGIAEERWMATPVACHRSFQGGEPTPRGLAVDLKRAKLGST